MAPGETLQHPMPSPELRRPVQQNGNRFVAIADGFEKKKARAVGGHRVLAQLDGGLPPDPEQLTRRANVEIAGAGIADVDGHQLASGEI